MFKERYFRVKKVFLNDSKLNSNNKNVVKNFLRYEEYKLKRRNGLSELDERSYKTLYAYIGKIKNINEWFKNKDWNKLTAREIKNTIDNLEDGIIKNHRGGRYSDRAWYYQIMQGELFRMVDKNHIVSEIIRKFGIKGRKDDEEVRFISEESVKKLVDCAITPEQRCLLWLAFDIGENINSLLELEKNDFKRQINPDTKEPEYLVILSRDKLKRTRTPRSELTNYSETVNYLNIVIDNLKPAQKTVSNKYIKRQELKKIHGENKLFKFRLKSAQRFLDRASKKAGVRCLPKGQKVTWKDLRSSMACDLLRKEWSRDEVNARLGHKPSSRIIDRYINFLALDRNKPKKKVFESNLRNIKEELSNSIELGKLQGQRLLKQEEKISSIKKSYSELEMQFNNIKEKFSSLEKGKGFMNLITGLLKQQQKMSKTLEKISGKKFDIVLPV